MNRDRADSGRGLQEVGEIFVPLGVLARGDLIDDLDVHAEFDLFGVEVDADQVRLDRSAAFEVGDSGDEWDVHAGKGTVDDRERMERSLVREAMGFDRVTAATFRTGQSRFERDRSAALALEALQKGISGLGDLQERRKGEGLVGHGFDSDWARMAPSIDD